MKTPQINHIAEKMLLPGSSEIADQLTMAQVRLARALGHLWNNYAEILDVRGGLLAAAGERDLPVSIERFRPGDTLRVGEFVVRTDPRLALFDGLDLDHLQAQLGTLGQTVLKAPELARDELLRILSRLNSDLLQILADHGEEQDTDEFPVHPAARPEP